MKRFSFMGGIHLDYCKEFTRNKAIELAAIPNEVEIPLAQHIGAPAKAIVSPGDYVKIGQKIGEMAGFVSANVHASVSGEILSVSSKYQMGKMVSMVRIKNNGKDEWDESVKGFEGIDDLTAQDIRRIVEEAGIVGMGGATFPTHVKLSPSKEHTIDMVILNGAECEPYLTADHRLMVERPADVIFGLKTILKVLGVEKGVIGIEDNKPDAIEKIKRAAGAEHVNIEVIPLRTKYPQGGEKQLVKAITGREVPSQKLPAEVGCAIFNVGTAAAISRAIKTGVPVIERIMTITGRGVKEPKNLRVRIGTPIKELVDQCGGLSDNASKIVAGGPMMGIARDSLDTPVTKGTSGILVLTKDETKEHPSYPCIKCARCVDACPMGLLPIHLANAVEKGDLDKALQLNLMDCVECGCCSYSCPAKRQLLQHIRVGKGKVRMQKK